MCMEEVMRLLVQLLVANKMICSIIYVGGLMKLLEQEYKLIKDNKECFNLEEIEEK